MPKRYCSNWLETYLEYTATQESPEVFHLWTGLSVLAASVGRSIKIYKGHFDKFANLYVVLIAGSGRMRKSTALKMGQNIYDITFPEYSVFEEKATIESLISAMHLRYKTTQSSEIYIVADEFNTLIGRSKQDQSLISHLTKFYDCPDRTGSRTITRGYEECINVCCNMLASTTPHWLRLSLPTDVIGGGFTSRIIFVYQETTDRCNPFPVKPGNWEDLEFQLVEDLKTIQQIDGTVDFTSEALEWYIKWYKGFDKADTCDDLLMGYYSRRHDYLCKVATLISLAKSDDLVVEIDDMMEAHKMLAEQEAWLPKIMQMLQTNVVGEATSLVLNIIAKQGRISHSNLMRRVSYRLSSQELSIIIHTLETAGYITLTNVNGRLSYQLVDLNRKPKEE